MCKRLASEKGSAFHPLIISRSTVSEDLLVLLTLYFVRDKAGERLDIRFPSSSWNFIFADCIIFFCCTR
jgi:hypothetical protein